MIYKLIFLSILCCFALTSAVELRTVKEESGFHIDAYEAGQRLGQICVRVYELVEKKYAYISLLHIDQAHQKRGVGTMLLHKALEYAKTYGIQEVKLEAYPFTREIALEKLVAFYEQFGFKKKTEERYEGQRGVDMCLVYR